MLVKSRERTGRTQTLPWWLGGEVGKDDIKPNTLAPLELCKVLTSGGGVGVVKSSGSIKGVGLLNSFTVFSALELNKKKK